MENCFYKISITHTREFLCKRVCVRVYVLRSDTNTLNGLDKELLFPFVFMLY